MKKTLALLLAIGGSASFANPDLEGKVRQLLDVTRDITIAERDIAKVKGKIEGIEKRIKQLEVLKILFSDLVGKLRTLLPSLPLNSRDLSGRVNSKNVLDQLKSRTQYVSSQEFSSKFHNIISEFKKSWDSMNNVLNKVSGPLNIPSPIYLTEGSNALIEDIEANSPVNGPFLPPWVVPLLEKVLDPSIPYLYLRRIPAEALPPPAHPKVIAGNTALQRIVQSHERNVRITDSLYGYIRDFVTHPFGYALCSLNDKIGFLKSEIDNENRLRNYYPSVLTKLNEQILSDLSAKSQLEKEIQHLKSSTAQEPNEETEKTVSNPAAPSTEDMDKVKPAEPSLEDMDPDPNMGPQPNNILPPQIPTHEPWEYDYYDD